MVSSKDTSSFKYSLRKQMHNIGHKKARFHPSIPLSRFLDIY